MRGNVEVFPTEQSRRVFSQPVRFDHSP